MAYKFQYGDAIMSGALEQEGEIDALELSIASNALMVDTTGKLTATEVSDLDGGIDVNDSKFTVSAAGAVVAVGINAGGALSGVTTLAMGGALSGVTTLDASGKITGNDFATDGDEWEVSALGAVSGLSATYSSNIASTAGTLSGAAGLAGLGLTIAPGKTLGVIGDLDLLTLDVNSFIVAGAAEMTGLTASSGVQLQSSLEAGGNIFLPGASAAVFAVSDSVYFLDSDGAVKRDSWSDMMGATAGAGITNTAGVLSADSAATPNAIGDLSVLLLEGFNYATASLSAPRTYTLPASPTAGDVVHVKVMGGVDQTNYGAITGSAADDTDHFLIDGRTDAIRLESVSGAVSLIWTATNAVGWAIY